MQVDSKLGMLTSQPTMLRYLLQKYSLFKCIKYTKGRFRKETKSKKELEHAFAS